MVQFVVCVILSFVISETLGSKRNIGSGWSLFLCLAASPVFGLILTLTSKKKGTHVQYGTAANTAFLFFGSTLLLLGIFMGIRLILRYSNDELDYFEKDMIVRSTFVITGLIAIGSYFIRIIVKKGNC